MKHKNKVSMAACMCEVDNSQRGTSAVAGAEAPMQMLGGGSPMERYHCMSSPTGGRS